MKAQTISESDIWTEPIFCIFPCIVVISAWCLLTWCYELPTVIPFFTVSIMQTLLVSNLYWLWLLLCLCCCPIIIVLFPNLYPSVVLHYLVPIFIPLFYFFTHKKEQNYFPLVESPPFLLGPRRRPLFAHTIAWCRKFAGK